MDVARLTDAEVSRSFPGRNFRCGRNKSCRSGINPHERTGPTQGRGHRGDVAVYRDTDRVFWRCAYAALVAEIVAVPTRAPVSRAVARRADWSRRHNPPLSAFSQGGGLRFANPPYRADVIEIGDIKLAIFVGHVCWDGDYPLPPGDCRKYGAQSVVAVIGGTLRFSNQTAGIIPPVLEGSSARQGSYFHRGCRMTVTTRPSPCR